MVSDGRGGLWALGFNGDQLWRLWHYTAGHWGTVSAHVSGPSDLAGLASSLAWIPGSRSVWAAGGAGSYPTQTGRILLDGRG